MTKNPLPFTNLVRTPTSEKEIQDYIANCENPQEAAMVFLMTVNLCHDKVERMIAITRSAVVE